MKNIIINLINRLPYIKQLYKANQANIELLKNFAYPPGHYYSPIVSVAEIIEKESTIWYSAAIDGVKGIDLRAQHQITLLKQLAEYYNELPFTADKQTGMRYYLNNTWFPYTDGILLYAMLRHFKPKRVIEVGSGYSSAVMLDTNQLFFDGYIQLTFIEPYPERLYSLIFEADKKTARVIVSSVQSIKLDEFEKLENGDILFIDSSHVVKTASDLHYILFEVLPVLRAGVMVHFHDVFYPFEYPKQWVIDGRNWNEDYFLRAFFMYNTEWEILLFSNYLHLHHYSAFKSMPLCYHDPGAGLWIKKK